MSLPLLAIVGSPNVGKSTIFNRIVGERRAIVDDQPGVTRDRHYALATWLGRQFNIVDTGGVEITNRPFQDQIRIQVQIAIDEADVILFLCDAKLGITADDKYAAKMLYNCKKPIILAINKVDDFDQVPDLFEFYSLGLGDPISVSGVHGIGIGDVLDSIVKQFKDEIKEDYSDSIVFSLIGRPNVGKSSLMNAILGSERVIVSDIAGTTRDSIDTEFSREDKKYIAIDTAGLVKKGRIYESVDKYSALRAMRAVERSKIVLLVINADEGILEQDKHVLEYATENHKAVIIVVNKWDLVTKTPKAQQEFEKKIRDEFVFVPYAPIVFTSAKTKSKIDKVIETIDFVYNAYNTRVKTSLLNDVIRDACLMNEAPDFNGGRVKVYYANQVESAPPTIVLFVNNPKYMHFSYQRYLENRIRDSFNFDGTPISFVLRMHV